MPDQSAENPTTDKASTFRRQDFWVAASLWVVSLLVLLESIQLTFHIELPGISPEKVWLVAPGTLPLFLSGGLLIMLTLLLGVAATQGNFKGHIGIAAMGRALTNSETVSKAAQMILLCIYVFGLLGRIHFGIATVLYLFTAMLLAKAGKLWLIALISVLVAGAVTITFGQLMKIPLP